jgi:hypothetical protein
MIDEKPLRLFRTMTGIVSTVRVTPSMSPRTVKYVGAMIGEGDNFDYHKWLNVVRDEEAQATQVSATSASGEAAPVQIKSPSRTSTGLNTSSPRAVIKAVPVARAIWRLRREGTSKGPNRWLKKVSDAWNDFQASRARDAVYEYLNAVFAIVEHYRVRRRIKKLLRHAFKFANLPFAKNANPFTAVIRCTCDDEIDSKTISKWARALRYVARCNKPRTRLKTFMKETGGVNACAARYAKLKQRRNRRN